MENKGVRRRFSTSLLIVVGVLAACGDSGISGTTLGDIGTDAVGTNPTTVEETGTEDAATTTGESAAAAAVEGAYAYGFSDDEIWALNPDTGAMGTIAKLEDRPERLWLALGELWVATQEQLVHLDTQGRQLGVIELEWVRYLVSDGDAIWVEGGSPPHVENYLAKLDPATHTVVASIPHEFGPPVGVAIGGGSLWIRYFVLTDREIARVDLESLATIATTTIEITSGEGLVWGEESLWAAGPLPGDPSAPTPSLGVVRISPDGNVQSQIALSDAPGVAVQAMTVGLGGLWLLTDEGQVLRVDPTTGAETARIQLPDSHFGSRIYAASGRVWIWVPGLLEEGALYVIDPASNESTLVLSLPGFRNQIVLATDDL